MEGDQTFRELTRSEFLNIRPPGKLGNAKQGDLDPNAKPLVYVHTRNVCKVLFTF